MDLFFRLIIEGPLIARSKKKLVFEGSLCDIHFTLQLKPIGHKIVGYFPTILLIVAEILRT